MGKHLDAARRHFGTDTRGMLDGGRHALLHTRSLEFDELRQYVPGDDVRDIDWKATARSGSVLIKRFVTEMHHKVLLVADAGTDMTGLAPSGEPKYVVAGNILGAIGLITLGRSDQLGLVFGDSRGSVNIGQRRGENHVENVLARYHDHAAGPSGPSDIACQLDYIATHYRHPMLIVVVSDEPDTGAGLTDVLAGLRSRHDMLWAMVDDMPATAGGAQGGFDVSTGRSVLGVAAAAPAVIAAYRRAEAHRRQRLVDMLTAHAIAHTRISGSAALRGGIVEMTGMWSRAG